ncbi:L-arabinose isomerase [compost metagenome]
MVMALSKLFRISLNKGKDLITLEKEIEHLQSYLTIQQMRYRGTHYKLLINEVSAFEPKVPAPNLPVARVLWTVKPNFQDGVKAWSENGGGHHTVVSLNLTTDQIVTYAKLVNLEYVVIK